MITIITDTSELPKDQSYRVVHERPAEDVTAYEFTNWLQTVWFVVVDYDRLPS